MCVCGLGCVPRRTVPRRTAQTRLSQPACRLLARCRAGAAAAGVARVRALLQGHAPVVGLPRRLGKSARHKQILVQREQDSASAKILFFSVLARLSLGHTVGRGTRVGRSARRRC